MKILTRLNRSSANRQIRRALAGWILLCSRSSSNAKVADARPRVVRFLAVFHSGQEMSSSY